MVRQSSKCYTNLKLPPLSRPKATATASVVPDSSAPCLESLAPRDCSTSCAVPVPATYLTSARSKATATRPDRASCGRVPRKRCHAQQRQRPRCPAGSASAPAVAPSTPHSAPPSQRLPAVCVGLPAHCHSAADTSPDETSAWCRNENP